MWDATHGGLTRRSQLWDHLVSALLASCAALKWASREVTCELAVCWLWTQILRWDCSQTVSQHHYAVQIHHNSVWISLESMAHYQLISFAYTFVRAWFSKVVSKTQQFVMHQCACSQRVKCSMEIQTMRSGCTNSKFPQEPEVILQLRVQSSGIITI